MLQLEGYTGNAAVMLMAYIGTDQGKIRPHGFYQACQVSGKNATPSIGKDIEGTTVIEIKLEPSNDMTAV